MKILFINKFLYPNGGSETYIFKLGDYLKSLGHEVEYFGMEHKGRCVGNRVGAYTADMDFHGGSKLSKLFYPLKTINSGEARKKLRLVLDDFRPDVVHLNNFNYQLTPSVIVETRRWEKQTGHPVRIVYTAHDYQLICPNHMLMNPMTGKVCEKCIGGHYFNCAKGKCIHGSRAKSLIGTEEARYWRRKKTYREIDAIICCSRFMKEKLDTHPHLVGRTVALHNFIDAAVPEAPAEKKDYVLYFGRLSEEKGIGTLMKAARKLPDIPFIVAGGGPLEESVKGVPNVTFVGFKTGDALRALISEARMTVYPSEWYENCPFSVMESQMYGTPVIGANIGGIPELIETGDKPTGILFESGNAAALAAAVRTLWDDPARTAEMSRNCLGAGFDTVAAYTEKLMPIYLGKSC